MAEFCFDESNVEEDSEPPLRFSSHMILNSDHSLENPFLMIPMGLIFSPFAVLKPNPVVLKRNPILCLGCASYISPFVNIDDETGNWQCTFCNAINPCYSDELIGYNGEESSDFPELSHKVVEYSDHLSHTDPSFILPLATGPHRQRVYKDIPALIFLIDGTIIDENMEELKESMLAALTAANENASIGIIVFSSVVKIFRLGVPGLTVSDTFSGQHLHGTDRIEKNIGDYLVHMDSGIDNIIEALTSVKGIPLPVRKTKRRMHKALENFAGMDTQGRYCSTNLKARNQKRCFGIAVEYALQLAQFSDRDGSHIICCVSGCPNYGPGAIISHDAGRTAEINDEALRIATHYYRDLSKQALNQGTAIDIFCGGAERLGIPVMQSLVEKTGGYTLVHTSFSSQFCDNLQKILMAQSVSSHGAFQGCIVDIRTSQNIQIKHVIGPAGVSDSHEDVDRAIYEMNAQAASSSNKIPNTPAADGGAAQEETNIDVKLPEYDHLCRMVMGRKDPISTLSVYYESALIENYDSFSDMAKTSDPSISNAHFQFVIRHATDGQVVTRVVTHRIPITRQTETYLESLDEDVVGILIAKQAILQAANFKVDSVQSSAVEQAQSEIDFVLQSISHQYRVYARGKSKDLKTPTFPPILSGLPRRLFQLRRGPLLGTMIQNMDDAACLRNLFLRAPLLDCMRMMSPDLLCWEPGLDENTLAETSAAAPEGQQMNGSVEDCALTSDGSPQMIRDVPSKSKLHLKVLPMETLAMQSNKILVLDHHDRVLIWSGQDVCGKEFDHVREAFQHYTYLAVGNRIPTPTIALFKEGSSMSRFFISRLIPSHKDPVESQLEMFSELQEFSPQQLQAFCDKFPKTDDSSFFQYFWNIVR